MGCVLCVCARATLDRALTRLKKEEIDTWRTGRKENKKKDSSARMKD